MQLTMVKRILKYESDRGGAQNTIDFKVLDSRRSDQSEEGEIDGKQRAKCHCPDKGKTRNARQNAKSSAPRGMEDRIQETSMNE